MQAVLDDDSLSARTRFEVADRSVVVSGGAQGLGLAVASAFAGGGARVAVLDIDQVALDQAGPALAEIGKAVAVRVDVRDDEAVRGAVDTVATAFGGVDVLVNAAAVFPRGATTATSARTFLDTLDINLVGPHRMVTAALPHLRASNHGRVINFGSVTFHLGEPDDLGAYIATKGGIVGLTRALARELGPLGITVNVIEPGSFATRGQNRRGLGQDEFARRQLARQCVKRLGAFQDIAAAALFLGSDAAEFITGQTLLVDGGWTFG